MFDDESRSSSPSSISLYSSSSSECSFVPLMKIEGDDVRLIRLLVPSNEYYSTNSKIKYKKQSQIPAVCLRSFNGEGA